MSSGAPLVHSDIPDWRELYRAALFETDTTKLANRIAVAEQAIIARGRQLFGAVNDATEDEALDDALYALRALKSCLHLNTLAA